jgi:hypothetical protein
MKAVFERFVNPVEPGRKSVSASGRMGFQEQGIKVP